MPHKSYPFYLWWRRKTSIKTLSLYHNLCFKILADKIKKNEKSETRIRVGEAEMAVAFISTAKTFLSSHLPPCANPLPSPQISASSSSSSAWPRRRNPNCSCRSIREGLALDGVTKRSLGLSLSATLVLSLLAGSGNGNESCASAAILEADDDDVELMERVKKDRQKRIERQGVINSSKQETGYLQELVYKLSEVGQAIENNDLKTASSVLGPNTNTEWIKKANSALNKLSFSPEQKEVVETFNSSMAKLISCVDQKDEETSKIAFVSSAAAFEKWTLLTGVGEELKGI